jgi:NAD(P)-dependent dehydrogenase (short-subunit alcohol dehydrogenase family)
MNLSGKVVLITGAARGIGAETARQARARGARLALIGLEPERLQALQRELGEGHVWAECDVTKQGSLEHAVATCVDALGGLDVVVANAGVASHGTVAVTPMDALARTVDVNLTGVMRTVSVTLPHVTARRGYYLLVSSAAAIRAAPGLAAYSATKAGVEFFGSALRLEVAHKGVAVGIAHPCWIDTDMVRDAKDDLPSFREMLTKLPYPFGSVTSVETCARAFVDGMERRERTIFVPKALAPFAKLRQFLSGPMGDRVLLRDAKDRIPQMEEQVRGLGRSFGTHSVAVPKR